MKKTEKTDYVEKIINGGWGIVRDKEGVVFLNGVCPEENVRYKIRERAKGVFWGELLSIVESSEIRRKSECSYTGKCGGCSLLHIKYPEQLTIKREILMDDLKRIGGIDSIKPEIVHSKEYGYRIRVKLKGLSDGSLGFIRKGTNEVMQIDKCLIASERINKFIKKWNSFEKKPFFHQLDLFDNIDKKKLYVFLSRKPDEEYMKFLSIFSDTFFTWSENRDKGVSELKIGDFIYLVSPENFFQVNMFLHETMLKIVKDHMIKSKKVIDLYCGNGFFIPVLKLFSTDLTGVENNKNAVNMAERSFPDVKFLKLDVDKYEFDEFDVVIADPPRAGLSENLKEKIVKKKIKRLIYISCSTATLSRDLKYFISEGYEVKKMTMLDMFPNTAHIETISLITKQLNIKSMR